MLSFFTCSQRTSFIYGRRRWCFHDDSFLVVTLKHEEVKRFFCRNLPWVRPINYSFYNILLQRQKKRSLGRRVCSCHWRSSRRELCSFPLYTLQFPSALNKSTCYAYNRVTNNTFFLFLFKFKLPLRVTLPITNDVGSFAFFACVFVSKGNSGKWIFV